MRTIEAIHIGSKKRYGSSSDKPSCIGGAYLYEIGHPGFLRRLFGAEFHDVGRIYVYAPSQLKGSASYYRILIHEIEHAVQRLAEAHSMRAVTPQYLTPKWQRYFREFGSMRAEWEWLSLLTSQQIQDENEILEQRGILESERVRAAAEFAASTFAAFRDLSPGYGSYALTEATYRKLNIND